MLLGRDMCVCWSDLIVESVAKPRLVKHEGKKRRHLIAYEHAENNHGQGEGKKGWEQDAGVQRQLLAHLF
jgi:hypothetical protein